MTNKFTHEEFDAKVEEALNPEKSKINPKSIIEKVLGKLKQPPPPQGATT